MWIATAAWERVARLPGRPLRSVANCRQDCHRPGTRAASRALLAGERLRKNVVQHVEILFVKRVRGKRNLDPFHRLFMCEHASIRITNEKGFCLYMLDVYAHTYIDRYSSHQRLALTGSIPAIRPTASSGGYDVIVDRTCSRKRRRISSSDKSTR